MYGIVLTSPTSLLEADLEQARSVVHTSDDLLYNPATIQTALDV